MNFYIPTRMQAMLRKQERADAATRSATQKLRDQLVAAERSHRSVVWQLEELQAHQQRVARALQEVVELPTSCGEGPQDTSGCEYIERLVVEVVMLHQQSTRAMERMQQVCTRILSACVTLQFLL
jgi:seryl-tRNA synthetase